MGNCLHCFVAAEWHWKDQSLDALNASALLDSWLHLPCFLTISASHSSGHSCGWWSEPHFPCGNCQSPSRCPGSDNSGHCDCDTAQSSCSWGETWRKATYWWSWKSFQMFPFPFQSGTFVILLGIIIYYCTWTPVRWQPPLGIQWWTARLLGVLWFWFPNLFPQLEIVLDIAPTHASVSSGYSTAHHRGKYWGNTQQRSF